MTALCQISHGMMLITPVQQIRKEVSQPGHLMLLLGNHAYWLIIRHIRQVYMADNGEKYFYML